MEDAMDALTACLSNSNFHRVETRSFVSPGPLILLRNHAATTPTIRARLDDAIWSALSDAYNEAYACYEQDELKECIQQCSKIPDEAAALPRYIRIMTLILLAVVVKEEEDFRAAHVEAGTIIHIQLSLL